MAGIDQRREEQQNEERYRERRNKIKEVITEQKRRWGRPNAERIAPQAAEQGIAPDASTPPRLRKEEHDGDQSNAQEVYRPTKRRKSNTRKCIASIRVYY